MVRVVFTGWLTGSGFDLAWFSFLSSEHLCIFGLHGAAIYVEFFLKFFTLHFSKAEHGGIGP